VMRIRGGWTSESGDEDCETTWMGFLLLDAMRGPLSFYRSYVDV
jgi:hypothetical protein